MNTSNALLDIPQAAERLGVSQSLVRRYCREGRLGFKVGSRWVIDADQLKQFAGTPRKRGRPHNASDEAEREE